MAEEAKKSKKKEQEEAAPVEKQEEAAPAEKQEAAKPQDKAEPEAPTPAEQKKFLSEAEKVKQELWKGPKSMFFIPLAPGENEGAYETVSINGYRCTIKKNVLVELPMPIIHLLAEHYRISVEAGKDKLVSREEAVIEALS